MNSTKTATASHENINAGRSSVKTVVVGLIGKLTPNKRLARRIIIAFAIALLLELCLFNSRSFINFYKSEQPNLASENVVLDGIKYDPEKNCYITNKPYASITFTKLDVPVRSLYIKFADSDAASQRFIRIYTYDELTDATFDRVSIVKRYNRSSYQNLGTSGNSHDIKIIFDENTSDIKLS